MHKIYLAGGCFWGLEKLMSLVPGVVKAVSGYANGNPDIVPSYEKVSTGKTGYRETVKVVYDPGEVSLTAILSLFFRVIDPTVRNQQGNDHGTQYQTGIYYTTPEDEAIILDWVAVERRRYAEFYVEIEPLTSFYQAEEYHQKYLEKNPGGYCHIHPEAWTLARGMRIDPWRYPRPSDQEIQEKLEAHIYRVTQEGLTDPPGSHPLADETRPGLYVDVVTGEPLFTSDDKYPSACGWPAFSAAIDPNTIIQKEDHSYGMERTEIRSRAGDSHLGHIFFADPHSPTGVRFCVNGSSLRFIPYDEMERAGYGYLKETIRHRSHI